MAELSEAVAASSGFGPPEAATGDRLTDRQSPTKPPEDDAPQEEDCE
jgi:hypothetical protein